MTCKDFIRADQIPPVCCYCRHRTHFLGLCVKSATKVDPSTPACIMFERRAHG